jgi:hypothetical protein
LLLQSTTCSRTTIDPESRWTRGAAFWAESEARVQIAPSGMMKKRKVGFGIFPHSWLAVALVTVDIEGEFFRLMSSIVSFVSWAARAQPGISQART